MDAATITFSAIVGCIVSLLTAYATSSLKMREAGRVWRRDLRMKYAEMLSQDAEAAARLASQFGPGYILVEDATGLQKRRLFLPPDSRIVVGRAASCDVVIVDPQLSGHHGVFSAARDRITYTDLGSTNGSNLNGRPLESGQQVDIDHGDIVTIGSSALTFRSLETFTALAA